MEVPKTGAEGEDTQMMAETEEVENAIRREVRFVNDGFDNKHDDDDSESDNDLNTEGDRFHQKEQQLIKTWRFGQGKKNSYRVYRTNNIRKHLVGTVDTYSSNSLDSM